MTPTWREHFKAVDRRGPQEAREMMARLRCFDLRPASDALRVTGIEVGLAMWEGRPAEGGGYEYGIDIGEGAVVPAPDTWLEGGDWFAILNERGPNRTGDPVYELTVTVPTGVHQARFVVGDYGVVFVPYWLEDPSPRPMTEGCRVAMSIVIAALAVINSPAARRKSVDSHRGIMRRAAQAAPVARTITHCTVTIGGAAATTDRSPAGSSSPKAYHFCRAHIRHWSDGSSARVRAHWRGDPAFGVRLPSYAVETQP